MAVICGLDTTLIRLTQRRTIGEEVAIPGDPERAATALNGVSRSAIDGERYIAWIGVDLESESQLMNYKSDVALTCNITSLKDVQLQESHIYTWSVRRPKRRRCSMFAQG